MAATLIVIAGFVLWILTIIFGYYFSRIKTSTRFSGIPYLPVHSKKYKMKPILMAICLVVLVASCNNKRTTLSFIDNKTTYTVSAAYPVECNSEVENYLDFHYGKNGRSFKGTEINGDLRLEDGTVIFMKKKQGYLAIRLNKEKNSAVALRKVHRFGEGLKLVLP